jgi:2-amino-4-hydroxy-6-hydroxymethyldihydropteridine diphosphokinase
MHAVTLGLGANLGDRLRSLQAAVDLLADGGVRTVASSRVWETEPIGGPPDQPSYLNAVIRTETEADPNEVLAICNHVEASSVARAMSVGARGRSTSISCCSTTSS